MRNLIKQFLWIWGALWLPFLVVGVYSMREILGPGLLLLAMLAAVTFSIGLVYFAMSIVAAKVFGYQFTWKTASVFLVVVVASFFMKILFNESPEKTEFYKRLEESAPGQYESQ